jgi:hypothetical protein
MELLRNSEKKLNSRRRMIRESGTPRSHRMRGMRVDGRIEKAPAQASVPGEAKDRARK